MHVVQGRHYASACQRSSTEQYSKRHIKDYFKLNGKQMIKIPTKDAYINFKACVR